MKKQTRRLISISVLIILILIIFYCFNIFNLKYIIEGISVNKVINGDTTITTTTGKSLKLPQEFLEHNILLPKEDTVISIICNETTKDDKKLYSTEAVITTPKSINDVFDYYSSTFSNPITTKTDKTAIIIGGDAENLIKLTIDNGMYKIYMEKR